MAIGRLSHSLSLIHIWLSPVAGLQLLRERGVIAPSASLETLVERYSGNPLALKLVADTVRDLFGADVNAFLRGGTPLFDDIRGVLDLSLIHI